MTYRPELIEVASGLAAGQRARRAVRGGRSVVMDRHWLSTVSYARARGVALDLTAVAGAVVRPDVTVLLTLDEEERQ